jgi:CxxC motif-containing protein (DUF1111 family)
MKKYFLFIFYISFFLSCSKEDLDQVVVPVEIDKNEEYPGGLNNTVLDFSPNAFGHQSPGLSGMQELNFAVGNSFFNQNWVASPASTTARDGLGPTFNARSCSSCHFKDGRGRPPSFDGEQSTGFLIRLSLVSTNPNEAPVPHPAYGTQLNSMSNVGILSEGDVHITYSNEEYSFPDGETYSLQTPDYTFANLNYGDLSGVLISPRVGQHMIGLGLLETISPIDILANVDEEDLNNDGVSGRVNYVPDVIDKSLKIGRFGWKAGQPNVKQQSADAFVGDIGITSSMYPSQNCTSPQNDCLDASNGGEPELTDRSLGFVELYASNLSVPARRNFDSESVKNGKTLFNNAGCVSCHKSNYRTGVNSTFPNLSNQEIWPYTDLLLHDMGPELADNRSEYVADGQEWRTPPLWGVGLFETVNRHTFFLHDGRARNLLEAIMWHGGEAESSKNNFANYSKTERDQLIEFVKSL